MPNLNGMAGDFRPEFAQKQLCERSRSNASRSLPRGSSLQNIACIMKIKLLRARKVRVPRSRSEKLLSSLPADSAVASTGRMFSQFAQSRFSIRSAMWSPDCLTVLRHSRENIRSILFYLLTSAAPIAKLPPMQLMIDKVHIHRQRRGQARNKRKQRLSMRFTRRIELQHLRERPHQL